MTKPQSDDPLEAERLRRQRARNIAVGLMLGAFVILTFAVTIVRIKAGYHP